MDGNIARESAAELNLLRQDANRFVGRRIVMWAVRWVIGFAVIGAVTYFNEGFDWLWWAGLGLAGTSLVLMLVMHWLMARKLAGVQGDLDRLDAIIKEAGDV